jgi:hypothetical protein
MSDLSGAGVIFAHFFFEGLTDESLLESRVSELGQNPIKSMHGVLLVMWRFRVGKPEASMDDVFNS